ncbi:MAG: Gfo/Idh/MocA family oxidoreductase [Actinobacteria bacterium]|nr:MAG: Gfo/Idh/MocA family oxidoreductase [Actinomycetota bacterium]
MTTTVALVGYGYWGPNLLRNYMELPEATVKWVCDLDAERAAKAVTRYPTVGTSTNLDEVLADPEVDAVVIATPISTHYPLAMKALAAGKHVFVEKPMATSSQECDEMAAAAKAAGLVLMVGHTFVYSPPVRKVKEIIESGELGDVYFVTSSRVNLGLHQRDVSVVWDLAPHDLSILHYWLGETPTTVSVLGRSCINNGIPDVAFMNMQFGSGVVAECEVSWLSPVKLRRTIVVGSKRMLLYDDTENVEKVKIFDHGVDYKDPETFGEFQLAYRTGDIISPKLPSFEPLNTEARHFLECIATGAEPITGAAAGRSVVAALEAAERSLRGDGGAQQVS